MTTLFVVVTLFILAMVVTTVFGAYRMIFDSAGEVAAHAGGHASRLVFDMR